MNHLIEQDARLAAARAEIESLRKSFLDLRSLAFQKSEHNPMDNGLAGYLTTKQVASWCEQASSLADEASAAAYLAEVGPAIAYGGCPHRRENPCVHEPSLRPNQWHCPLCAELLPGEWNDTDARAQERMRKHWRTTHAIGTSDPRG